MKLQRPEYPPLNSRVLVRLPLLDFPIEIMRTA